MFQIKNKMFRQVYSLMYFNYIHFKLFSFAELSNAQAEVPPMYIEKN